MNSIKHKNRKRARRQKHVRRMMNGTSEKPRLAVFRSNRHIYCQVIDDVSGKTISSASTRDREIRSAMPYGGNVDSAGKIGLTVAEKAVEKGVEKVVFDRRGYKYHGRIKALADGARKGGLKF